MRQGHGENNAHGREVRLVVMLREKVREGLPVLKLLNFD